MLVCRHLRFTLHDEGFMFWVTCARCWTISYVVRLAGTVHGNTIQLMCVCHGMGAITVTLMYARSTEWHDSSTFDPDLV